MKNLQGDSFCDFFFSFKSFPEEESEVVFTPLCIFQPELVEIQGCLRMKSSWRGESDQRVFQRFFPGSSILGINCRQLV
jgi:hypothetical protein